MILGHNLIVFNLVLNDYNTNIIHANPIAFNAFFCSRMPNRFQNIIKFMVPDMMAAKTDGTSMAAAPPSRVKVVQTIQTKAVRG
jgi:hypothetical protein